MRPLLEWLEDRATPTTTVTGTAGDDLLVVYLTPGGGPADMTYVLNNNAPVNLSGETSFTFNGGDGNDTVVLSGTAAGCAVTLNGEGGNDSFFIGTCDGRGTGTTLGGPLTVNGGAGANLLSVLDGARTTGTEVYWDYNRLVTTNFTILHDGTFSGGLLVTTGSGNDVVRATWIQSGSDNRVYTQGGDDSFVVSYHASAFYPSITGPLLVDGGAGANRVTFDAGYVYTHVLPVDRTVTLTADTCRIDNLPVVYTATGGSFAGGVYVVSNEGNDNITVLSARADGPTFIYAGDGSDAITVHVAAGSDYNLIVNASASPVDGTKDRLTASSNGTNGSLTIYDDTGGAVIGRATSSATAGVVQLLYGNNDVSEIAYLNVDGGVTTLP
jgi:hypothetical protein